MHIRGARGVARPIARVVVACGAVGIAVASGCSTTKPTELVPGVMTQLRVPHDLRAVQVEVDANGRPVFCQGYDVDQAGVVELPATLGLVSATSPNTIVKVVIRGYDAAGAAAGTYTNTCPDSTPAGTAPAPRVLRTSIQSFVDRHTLFLPMALSYSCFDEDCSGSASCGSSECVCKGAQCVTAKTDANKLVDFDPSLIDGKGVCFSPSACFPPGPATFALEPVDPDRCVYEVPAGVGVNVRVLYQDVNWSVTPGTSNYEKTIGNASESEILDEDAEEGFCLGACPLSGASEGSAGDASSTMPSGEASAPAADTGTPLPDAGGVTLAGDASSGVGADAATDTGAVPKTDGQRFQLAPGLCRLVKAAHAAPPLTLGAPVKGYLTIGEVQVGLGCPTSKSPLLPICAAERNYGPALDGSVTAGLDGATSAGTSADVCGAQVPLVSTPSAVYLVMDDSSVMKDAFGVGGYATVMSLSLAAPVFSRTYAAFRYFPHSAGDAGAFDRSACTSATTEFSTPAVPFGTATEVQAQIGDQVRSWQPPGDTESNPAPLDLQAALRPSVGAYAAVKAFLEGKEATNVAAVMLFVNRLPTATNDCDPPVLGNPDIKTAIEQEIQTAYSTSPSVRTYFVVLGGANAPDGGVDPAVLAFYQALQSDLPQMVTTIDATLPTTQASQVLMNFSQAAEPLGTCLYEPVAGIGSVQYSHPADPGNPVVIPPNAACDAARQTTVDGWSLDQGRVRVCGTPCTDLQNTILFSSALAQQNRTPVPQVTVSGTIVCQGSAPGATASDASAMTAAEGALGTSPNAVALEDAAADGGSAINGSVSGGSASSGSGARPAREGGITTDMDGASSATAVEASSTSSSAGAGSDSSAMVAESGAPSSLVGIDAGGAPSSGSSGSSSVSPSPDASVPPVGLDAAVLSL